MVSAPRPDGRVRVAYFVPPSQHFAGIERVVHEIAAGLTADYGDLLEVHVIFAAHYEEDLLRNTAYTLHVLGLDRLRQLSSALRRCVAAIGADVLVCPQPEASVMLWLATRGLRLPVFVPHLHGNPRLEERNGSWRSRIAFQVFRHLLSRRVPGVLTVSPSLRDYTAEHLARHAPVYFAPNPVRELGAGERAHRDDRFHFLSVARLSHQKGQDLLLRALAQARPALPPVALTLVGNGPDEQELRRLSSELGLDDVVTFAGYVSDPAPHFRRADCFVLPSRWEGFGVVLVEALQFGLPLLAADCEFGPRDVVTDPRIGQLVPADDVTALAEGLTRAAHSGPDPDGDAFRRAAARGYSPGTTAAAHLAVLKQLVATRRPASRRLAAFASV